MFNRTFWRRMARLALIAAIRGAATAAGSGLITLIIWWITTH
jgi:plastocyanin domain-containing protein